MGHHNTRFDGDQYALSGVWSPPTSRANFCEEDYVISFYLAEFVNSLTNIAYIFLGLRYMYGPGSQGIFSPNWDFMSLSMLVLGIGSFLFHASLRQALEFVDELSMLVLAWSMLHALLLTSRRGTTGRDRLVSATLAFVFLGFSAFYVWSAKIIYQVIAFISSMAVLGIRTKYLLHWMQPALPADKIRAFTKRVWRAFGVSMLGYLLWNIEFQFCPELRSARRYVGLPWAWLLELHGWWHVLTAIGASMFMNVARDIRDEVTGSWTEDEKKNI